MDKELQDAFNEACKTLTILQEELKRYENMITRMGGKALSESSASDKMRYASQILNIQELAGVVNHDQS